MSKERSGQSEHPTGALALMLLYALMLVVLWLLIYLGIFLARG